MPGQQLRFEQWANFYAITSAAAATLLGLLFVVITLGAERRLKSMRPLITIYVTPAVIYFSSVLLMSALLAIPNQTRLTAVICVCLEGVAGLGYCGSLAIRRGAYEERADLFPYVLLPSAAYTLMVAGGLLLLRTPPIGLDLVAAGMLVLLGIAIRNSWAIAITVVAARD